MIGEKRKHGNPDGNIFLNKEESKSDDPWYGDLMRDLKLI